ncbi:universal stress protein [Halapricum hydrolyticum]|uniref:Universal stress protein n=1 Tax=Halapricum hydrolyticum TaxID=2979991 RepID=A0AAE3IEM0_9EURY|nr:universal stress protein [Halapricum hydrolyticum]MCU4717786.1 universal stress protein [Halapricum hydrolyticum]MCU4726950.1 universal stress protein [Halapricum hydrolyticum]
MYDHILVPTDGSKGTAKSIDHASAIARNNDALVHVLYVIDERLYRAASKDAKDEVIASLEEEGDRAIEDAVTRIEDHGAEVTTERLRGIPYKSILEYTDEEPIDMIVMGTHGRTGRDRIATLGSVTERVVKNADVPVLVVDIDGE